MGPNGMSKIKRAAPVLIVDDDLVSLELLAKQIANAGYAPLVARTDIRR